MRGSNSKRILGKNVSICSDAPLENGPSSKEDEARDEVDRLENDIHAIAATVVENVVRMASTRAAQGRGCYQNGHDADQDHQDVQRAKREKMKALALQRLPTIQIDTVPSVPSSPTDWSPPPEQHSSDEEAPLDETQIQFELSEEDSSVITDEVKKFVTIYVQDILSKAMVIAEKKLQFAGLMEEDEDEDEPIASTSYHRHDEDEWDASTALTEEDEEEIRKVAAQVVEEIMAKATEMATERMESSQSFPGLPTFQIDTVVSVPPSPASEEEAEQDHRWPSETKDQRVVQQASNARVPGEIADLVTFEDAPEDVQEVAASYIKEIVAKAVSMAEEKIVPTVPFSFDVDLMKTNGPWYIRAREALVRLLRTACFCTPRRQDS